MQIFHLLRTSLFLVLYPALVRYSVVFLSYSLNFFPPQVRNVAQLVLQKNKFKSFIVMVNTLYLFSPRLNNQLLFGKGVCAPPTKAGAYPRLERATEIKLTGTLVLNDSNCLSNLTSKDLNKQTK